MMCTSLRFRLLLPLFLLLTACASTTQEGAIGLTRKQFLLLSSDQVNAASLTSYRGELDVAGKAGTLNTDRASLERIRLIADTSSRKPRCSAPMRCPGSGRSTCRRKTS